MCQNVLEPGRALGEVPWSPSTGGSPPRPCTCPTLDFIKLCVVFFYLNLFRTLTSILYETRQHTNNLTRDRSGARATSYWSRGAERAGMSPRGSAPRGDPQAP